MVSRSHGVDCVATLKVGALSLRRPGDCLRLFQRRSFISLQDHRGNFSFILRDDAHKFHRKFRLEIAEFLVAKKRRCPGRRTKGIAPHVDNSFFEKVLGERINTRLVPLCCFIVAYDTSTLTSDDFETARAVSLHGLQEISRMSSCNASASWIEAWRALPWPPSSLFKCRGAFG